MNLLNDKLSLITGANRGIGNVIAKIFIEEGSDLILCTRKKNKIFYQWIDSLKLEFPNQKIYILHFDLQKENQINDAISFLINEKLFPNILVNNAGIASGGSFFLTKKNDLKKVLNINFIDTIFFTQKLVRLLRKSRPSSIINISSTASVLADPGTLAYGSSKVSLSFATKVLSKELSAFGIRVNAIAPTITNTDMLNEMDPKAIDSLLSRSALNRVCEPQEIANIAAFLASDKASIINGQIIYADGGII